MRARHVFTGMAPLLVLLGITASGSGLPAPPLSAAAESSCNAFLPPKQTVAGKTVGPEECRMREEATVADDSWPDVARVLGGADRKYQRVDMGISGTLAGYVVKDGPRMVEFTTAPEFVFPQGGNSTTPHRAVVKYDAAKGSGMTILYPTDAKAWNGKMYVTVHGQGRSFTRGNMKSWDQLFDPAAPIGTISKFEKLMLLKGYAVAITRRNSFASAGKTEGDYSVTLDDGTVLEGRNTGEAPELIFHFTSLARNYLKARLGRNPSRIYWYGKSGGARLGRLVSLQATNLDEHGKPFYDGIIVDDSGGGLWVPSVMKDGRNVLFDNKLVKERFVKTIEIVHQAYDSERNDKASDGAVQNFTENKRITARILRANGLDGRFRSYEVRRISHNGGETLPEGGRGDVQILPLWHLMDGFIDMLDGWVEGGTEPPVTKSDDPTIGDGNGDGIIEHEAISFPQVACPLGVYYQYPPSSGLGGTGNTGFAPFDGAGLEVLDGRTIAGTGNTYTQAIFADMNLNGYRDRRETVTEAWRRLKLLKPTETFTRVAYTGCVTQAVGRLQREKLLTQKVAAYYEAEAGKPLPEWVR